MHIAVLNDCKSNAQVHLTAHQRLTLIAHYQKRVIHWYNALFTYESRFRLEFSGSQFRVKRYKNERYVYGASGVVQSKEKGKVKELI